MFAQKSLLLLIIISLHTVAAFANSAKNVKDFGDYVVHYNALPTDFLSPATAKQVKVTRSRNRIMLNIMVKQKAKNKQTLPVKANVEVTAINLTGQLRKAKLRPIKEGTGVYYIGEFSVANNERLNFTVKVNPEKTSSIYTVKFHKTFKTK
jgi:hypothetical protein